MSGRSHSVNAEVGEGACGEDGFAPFVGVVGERGEVRVGHGRTAGLLLFSRVACARERTRVKKVE